MVDAVPEVEPAYLRLISVKLEGVREDVSEIKSDLKNDTVGRKEWALSLSNLEQRLTSMQGDIYHLRNLINDSKAPWWTYVTVFVAVGALLWSMFGPVI